MKGIIKAKLRVYSCTLYYSLVPRHSHSWEEHLHIFFSVFWASVSPSLVPRLFCGTRLVYSLTEPNSHRLPLNDLFLTPPNKTRSNKWLSSGCYAYIIALCYVTCCNKVQCLSVCFENRVGTHRLGSIQSGLVILVLPTPFFFNTS